MFLLVDEDTDKFYKNKHIRLGAWLATVKFLPLKPRIVDLFKGSDGYGYFLKAEPNKTGVCACVNFENLVTLYLKPTSIMH